MKKPTRTCDKCISFREVTSHIIWCDHTTHLRLPRRWLKREDYFRRFDMSCYQADYRYEVIDLLIYAMKISNRELLHPTSYEQVPGKL